MSVTSPPFRSFLWPSRPVTQRGFGLLEVILVFALILIAGAATFWVFQKAQTQSTADTTATQIHLVVVNVRSYLDANVSQPYSGAQAFSNGSATPQQWVDLGVIPKSMMWTGTGTPQAGLTAAGPIQFSPCLGCSPVQVQVLVSQISDDVCASLVASLFSTYPPIGIRPQLYVDNVGIMSTTALYSGGNFAACQQVNGHSNNHIIAIQTSG